METVEPSPFGGPPDGLAYEGDRRYGLDNRTWVAKRMLGKLYWFPVLDSRSMAQPITWLSPIPDSWCVYDDA